MGIALPVPLIRALGLAGICGVIAIGCSEDGTSSGNDPDDPDGGSGEIVIPPRTDRSIYEDLGIDDPMPDEHHFNEVEAPYDDVAGCKAFESAYPDVHSCSCDHCYDIQRQCDALDGCIEIAECGISIGCSDAFDCYLAPADKACVPIIDKWGNTGVSAALALQLGECTNAAACR